MSVEAACRASLSSVVVSVLGASSLPDSRTVGGTISVEDACSTTVSDATVSIVGASAKDVATVLGVASSKDVATVLGVIRYSHNLRCNYIITNSWQQYQKIRQRLPLGSIPRFIRQLRKGFSFNKTHITRNKNFRDAGHTTCTLSSWKNNQRKHSEELEHPLYDDLFFVDAHNRHNQTLPDEIC